MNARPAPSSGSAPPHRPGHFMLADRVRKPPTPGGLARRRAMITLTKWLLPACALALLASIALWPEFNRAADQARLAVRRITGDVEGVRLIDARYHSVDERGRPYTVTAEIALQVNESRIDLTTPKGDITTENGTWVMLQSRKGVYMPKVNLLDLSQDVTLYRDDGTTLKTESASVDLKNGAAASSDPVHAEGPFGTLDAQGFSVLDKGATVQFIGPAHVVLNGASP